MSAPPPSVAEMRETAKKQWDAYSRVLRECGHCGKYEAPGDAPFKRCADCKASLYCGRECQKNAWPAHKPICRARVNSIRAPGRGNSVPGNPLARVPDKFTPEQVHLILTDWEDRMRGPVTALADAASGLFPLKPGYNRAPILPNIFLSLDEAGKVNVDHVFLQQASEAVKQESLTAVHDRWSKVPGVCGTVLLRVHCGPVSHEMPIRLPEGRRGDTVSPDGTGWTGEDWVDFLRRTNQP